jgi:hypothetical protein
MVNAGMKNLGKAPGGEYRTPPLVRFFFFFFLSLALWAFFWPRVGAPGWFWRRFLVLFCGLLVSVFLTFLRSHFSLLVRLPSSTRASSVVAHPSSLIRRPSSVFRRLTSAVPHLTSPPPPLGLIPTARPEQLPTTTPRSTGQTGAQVDDNHVSRVVPGYSGRKGASRRLPSCRLFCAAYLSLAFLTNHPPPPTTTHSPTHSPPRIPNPKS